MATKKDKAEALERKARLGTEFRIQHNEYNRARREGYRAAHDDIRRDVVMTAELEEALTVGMARGKKRWAPRG